MPFGRMLAPTMSPPEVIQWIRTSMDPQGRHLPHAYDAGVTGSYADRCAILAAAAAEMAAALNSAACAKRTALHMRTHHKGLKEGLTGKALLGLKLTGTKTEYTVHSGNRHPSELQCSRC